MSEALADVVDVLCMSIYVVLRRQDRLLRLDPVIMHSFHAGRCDGCQIPTTIEGDEGLLVIATETTDLSHAPCSCAYAKGTHERGSWRMTIGRRCAILRSSSCNTWLLQFMQRLDIN